MYDYDTSNVAGSGAIFAFIAGAFIGAGVAMLLAPQSGAKTRRLLSDYADKAKDRMDSAIESGKEYLQAGMERGKEYFESARESGEELARQGEKAYKQGEKAYNKASHKA
jgi:gas vesicle protein